MKKKFQRIAKHGGRLAGARAGLINRRFLHGMKFDSSASAQCYCIAFVNSAWLLWMPTALALFPHGGNLAVVIRPALGGRRAALLSHRCSRRFSSRLSADERQRSEAHTLAVTALRGGLSCGVCRALRLSCAQRFQIALLAAMSKRSTATGRLQPLLFSINAPLGHYPPSCPPSKS